MDGGEVLGGRYRLEEVLGSGGTSSVWAAHDELLDRRVAVKMLAGAHARDAASRQRIRDEARVVAALSHPHIAPVHDFGETVVDGTRTPYIVMELVDGPTLAEHAAAGRLAPADAVRVCAEVAEALAAAHAAGLVHRDIKPANVILARSGAKVIDFGIAAAIGPSSGDGEPLGTPAYAAPERFTGDAAEASSDVYSLGVMLYRLLAGRLPGAAGGASGPPGVPPAVARLYLACLAEDPAARPTAARLAADLNAELARGLGEDPAPAPEPAPPRRRWRVPALVGGVLAAGALAAVMVLTGGPSPRAGGPQADGPAAPGSSGAPPAVAGSPAPSGGGSRGTGSRSPEPAVIGSATPPPATDPTAAPPSSAAPPPPPAGQAQTLSSEGGTVRAECAAGDRARLVSWAPANGYIVHRVDSGPAAVATAVFRRGQSLVTMDVSCSGGVPSAAVTRTER